MALIKCKECGSQISTNAIACPSCGAKLPRKTSKFTWFIVGLLLISIAKMMFGGEKTTEASSKIKNDPEQIAAKAVEKKRTDLAFSLANAIKESARNPESVKFSSMMVNQDASVACTEYRAQNGFGGNNIEHVVYANDKISKKAADWNKHCKGQMFDLKYMAD